MIDFEMDSMTISRQCQLLSVKRSRVYYTPRNPESQKTFKYALIKLIDQLHTEHPYYGSRRMTKSLNRMGYKVNRKRIQNYMREMGISAYYPGPNLSKRNRMHKVYPYLLRNLDINHRNQVWSVDISYIPMPKWIVYIKLNNFFKVKISIFNRCQII